MKRCFFSVALLLLLNHGVWACFFEKSGIDVEAIQKEIGHCSKDKSNSDRCSKLQVLASKLNGLVDELRTGPQQFGLKILRLQETIVAEEEALKSNPDQPSLRKQLAAHKESLQERLAIVKWLESPKS